jgi:hypothetical protein
MRENLARQMLERFGVGSLEPIANRRSPTAYSFTCEGSRALDLSQQLRALSVEIGYWPVILGNEKETRRVLEAADAEDGRPYREILAEAGGQTAEQWLSDRVAEQKAQTERYRSILEKKYGTARAEQMLRELEEEQAAVHESEEEWPEHANPITRFTIPFERVGMGPPKAEVAIALFPTNQGWEVPAHLNLGGWNDCPDAVGHVVMMKAWSERFGAELVGVNGDTIEMWVNRPPSTREDALRLAEQQFLYCEDIVTQGVQTIPALASGLLGNNIWFFWWD